MNRLILVISVCAIVATLGFFLKKPDDLLHIVQCDVGQGDALLVRWGYQEMLIDQGAGDAVTGCLAEYLPFWDRTIEVVIATHADQDHIGGLDDVLQQYRVKHLFMNNTDKDTQTLRQLHSIISKLQIEKNSAYLGDVISLKSKKGDVVFTILSPEKEKMRRCGFNSEKPEEEDNAKKEECPAEYADENNRSISGKLTFENFSMVMFGDAEAQIEEAVSTSALIGEVDVLKVSHHGSKYSTSDAFIQLIRPEIAIISVGKNNRFGHPTTRVIDTLRASNIQIYRTDTLGTIEIVSDGQSYSVLK